MKKEKKDSILLKVLVDGEFVWWTTEVIPNKGRIHDSLVGFLGAIVHHMVATQKVTKHRVAFPYGPVSEETREEGCNLRINRYLTYCEYVRIRKEDLAYVEILAKEASISVSEQLRQLLYLAMHFLESDYMANFSVPESLREEFFVESFLEWYWIPQTRLLLKPK